MHLLDFYSLQKKVTLAASMKRKLNYHQVKGVNGCVYQQLLFFDVTVINPLMPEFSGRSAI